MEAGDLPGDRNTLPVELTPHLAHAVHPEVLVPDTTNLAPKRGVAAHPRRHPLNDRVLPLFEQHELPMLRMLTDRGTEYCGRAEHHDYELYLVVNDIEHTKTKARTPQTNGICERFHKTVLQEFYQVTFRKKLYASLDELQVDLDEWLTYYNTERTHQGKMCCGRTPMDTLEDGKRIWKEKFVA